MQANVTSNDALRQESQQPRPAVTAAPVPQPAPDPTLMEGAVVLVFMALLAVFGVVGMLLAH